MNNFYDTVKTIYWNNLKLFNLIIAIVFVFAIHQILKSSLSPIELNKLIVTIINSVYPIIATISGTLLGFIITSVSIIVTFTESEKIKLLKETGYYDKLFKIYFDTIKSLAITTLISIIGIVSNSENIIWIYIIMASVVFSGLLMWASIWALEMIIRIVKN